MNDKDRIYSHSEIDAIMKKARVDRSRAINGFFSSFWGSQSNKKTNRAP